MTTDLVEKHLKTNVNTLYRIDERERLTILKVNIRPKIHFICTRLEDKALLSP
jgi:hypothetical protein